MQQNSKKNNLSSSLFLAAGGIMTSCHALSSFFASILTLSVIKGYLRIIFILLAGIIFVVGYKPKRRSRV
jgi:hypothetical protein